MAAAKTRYISTISWKNRGLRTVYTQCPPAHPGYCKEFAFRGCPGICKLYASGGMGNCHPQGYSRAFDTHAASYQRFLVRESNFFSYFFKNILITYSSHITLQLFININVNNFMSILKPCLPFRAKKMLIPGGQPGGSWAQLELTDALCIMSKNNNF